MNGEDRFSGVTHYTHVDVQPGGINIQHVEHLHQADILKAIGVELEVKKTAAQQEESTAPEVLESPEAENYWAKLHAAGFVDAEHKLSPSTTRKQAMYIAECFAARLEIKSKWKTFEHFWGISNLAQEKWDVQQTGTLPKRSKEIDKIFGV